MSPLTIDANGMRDLNALLRGEKNVTSIQFIYSINVQVEPFKRAKEIRQ